MSTNFGAPPPSVKTCLLSLPSPTILLVTLNRPRAMNSIPHAGHWELESVFRWFDREPTLRCAIITGSGKKAFCAGQDLIELGQERSGDKDSGSGEQGIMHPPGGFAGLSRRTGKKPVIAAVNGFALGGGFEIVLNWYCFSRLAAYIYIEADQLTPRVVI
jgi:enoyl-CoA hydratase/carnithine racemase